MFKKISCLGLTIMLSACSTLAEHIVTESESGMASQTAPGTATALATPFNVGAPKFKTVDIANQYTIQIPDDFAVDEHPTPNDTTNVPYYSFQAPNGVNFSVSVHPYVSSESEIPGKCAVSTELDLGRTGAMYCEGLLLNDTMALTEQGYAKYASTVIDMTLQCTMNSPCPREVPPEQRYSIEYVFAVPDKNNKLIIEFFAGDAFRGESDQVNGFEGLGAILHDMVIPSLTLKTPSVQTDSDEPTSIPSPANSASLTWTEENYTKAYSFRYPLELYSVSQASAILTVNWPGVIELAPKDGFNGVLGQPVSQTYRIKIAVQNNNNSWTMDNPAGFMSGAGALLTYSPVLLDANHPIQEYQIGAVLALRVDNLPTGQSGPQTHIMTIQNNKIYEWLIEPAQSTGDERNMAYVEAILSTFELK